MTFPEYWAALVAKNPLLRGTARLTVTPEKIKAMIEQAHAEGFVHAHHTDYDSDPKIFEKLFRR